MNFLKAATYLICLSMIILTDEADGGTNKRSSPSEPSGCEENGKYYNAFGRYKIGNCTDAYCNGDGNLDIIIICCEWNREIYQLDTHYIIDDCTDLHCQPDGEAEVWVSGCPALEPDCHQSITIRGQCCQVCGDE